MRKLPNQIHGDDWLPEDVEEDDGSYSSDYDYPDRDDNDRQYEEFYR
jgi:hypothetical protein